MASTRAQGASVGLGTLIREDLAACGGGVASAGFHAVAWYRFGRWATSLPQPGRTLVLLLYRIIYVFIRNFYGVELPATAQIGRRLHIAHQGGIILNPRTRIGDDCMLRQNTTIGVGVPGGLAPTIGDGVEIGAGAVIIGDITIGDNARIGPNAVVMVDVPAGASAFAAPARIIRLKDS